MKIVKQLPFVKIAVFFLYASFSTLTGHDCSSENFGIDRHVKIVVNDVTFFKCLFYIAGRIFTFWSIFNCEMKENYWSNRSWSCAVRIFLIYNHVGYFSGRESRKIDFRCPFLNNHIPRKTTSFPCICKFYNIAQQTVAVVLRQLLLRNSHFWSHLRNRHLFSNSFICENRLIEIFIDVSGEKLVLDFPINSDDFLPSVLDGRNARKLLI